MTVMEHREIEHVGFALYGFAPTTCPVGDMYQWAVDWFSRLGCTPCKAGADIGGKTETNYRTFQNLNRKLRDTNFDGVTCWDLVAVPEGYSARKQWEHSVGTMAITYSRSPWGKCLVFHIQEPLIRDRMEDFLGAARQACELLHPLYGIGYRRKFRFGPMLYGMSMQSGGNAAVDDDNMQKWAIMMQHEAYTLLRSVYPWNFLTGTQLNVMVGEMRLADWIASRRDRGRLSPFTDEITLWTVPDERIRPVRDELWNAGVVLDRKRDFEAKMYEYHVDHNVVAESIKTGAPLVHRPRTGPIPAEKVLGSILDAFGDSESRVLKVGEDGQLHEVPAEELTRLGKPPRKKRPDTPPE
jgi:hypothetical protein